MSFEFIFWEELIRFLINSILIGIILWLYTQLPVQLKVHKYFLFFLKCKGLNIMFTESLYYNNDNKIDWVKFKNRLKENFSLDYVNEGLNFIDLRSKSTEIILRLSEREVDKDSSAFSIRMLNPIQRKFFVRSAVKKIVKIFGAVNKTIPFERKLKSQITVDLCLLTRDITNNSIKKTFKYKDEQSSEITIEDNKVTINMLESLEIEGVVIKAIFSYLDLNLK